MHSRKTVMSDEKKSVEDALKKKYAQLKAKKEAKQRELQAAAAAAAAEGGTAGAGGAEPVQQILQQIESSAGQSRPPADDGRPDEPQSAGVVKASALDRSAIDAFKAMRGPAGGEPAAKRARATGAKLPSVPKRASTGGVGGQVSQAVDDGENREQPSGAGATQSAGVGDRIDGFPRRVHEVLQRIFADGTLRRDEIEDKVLQALRALPETDALRALDQFGNEDPSRIRNKAAYLWGIVRNLRDGRNKQLGGSGSFGRDDDRGGASVAYVKLLWPEEERFMQELGAPEGRVIEREFAFDNSACVLPPAESLYSDEPHAHSELARVRVELQQAQGECPDQDLAEWLKLMSQVSLTGRVVPHIRQTSRPELCSTSWVQVYEVLSAYPLIPAASQAEDKMRSLHLCEMAGASVAALNHFLKIKHPNIVLDWAAHTRLSTPELAAAPAVGARGEEQRFMRETKDHWVFGGDPSAYAIASATAAAIHAKVAPGSVDLVLADSGVLSDVHATHTSAGHAALVPRDAVRELPEADAVRVFVSQVAVALRSLAARGSLVMRAWALCEHQSVGLLFLLNCVFADVKVCRPATVQLAGGDTFVVCTGFKGLGTTHLDSLSAEVARSNANMNAMISKSNLPSEWLLQYKQCAQLFVHLHATTLRRDVRLHASMSGPERHEIRNKRDAAAVHWRARFDCRALASVHDRLVRDGLSVASHQVTTSAGGKQWIPMRGRFSNVQSAPLPDTAETA